MVLPVPLAPANRALMPSPRDLRGEAPGVVDRGRGGGRARRSRAGGSSRGSGRTRSSQVGGRLDPLGQAVHPRLGPGAAGIPEPGAQRVGGALGSSARTEAPTLWMLSASRWNWAARPSSRPSSRSAAGPTAPAHRSRCSRVSPRLTSSRTVGRPRRRSGSRAAISRGASSRSARAITGRGGGPSASWSHSISRRTLEPRFAVAERGQRLAVGRGGRKVISPHRVQAEVQAGARRRGDGPLARLGLAAEQDHRRGRHGGRPAPQPGGPPGHGGQRRRQRQRRRPG